MQQSLFCSTVKQEQDEIPLDLAANTECRVPPFSAVCHSDPRKGPAPSVPTLFASEESRGAMHGNETRPAWLQAGSLVRMTSIRLPENPCSPSGVFVTVPASGAFQKPEHSKCPDSSTGSAKNA